MFSIVYNESLRIDIFTKCILSKCLLTFPQPVIVHLWRRNILLCAILSERI